MLLQPSANFPATLEGIVLAKDLAPISIGVGEEGPTYYAQLTPEFVAESSQTGEFALIVIEDFTAFGVSSFELNYSPTMSMLLCPYM